MLGASAAATFILTAIVMLTNPLEFSWAFFMPLGLVAFLYFACNAAAVLSVGGNGNIGFPGHIIGFLIGLLFGMA